MTKKVTTPRRQKHKHVAKQKMTKEERAKIPYPILEFAPGEIHGFAKENLDLTYSVDVKGFLAS